VQDKIVALKRRLQDEDIAQELILRADSEVHISKDDISLPESDGDTEEDCRIDRLDRTNWTNATHS
jgi:hypothetical protein